MSLQILMSNRFKGLDLIDRGSEELWVEVHNIIQEAETQIISKKNKCKKAKWLSEEDLRAAEKTREVKGKGKMYPSECRVPETSKKKKESLLK